MFPALMADARAGCAARSDETGNRNLQRHILRRWPDFAARTETSRRVVCSGSSHRPPPHTNLATKARKALPDEPPIGRASGTIELPKKRNIRAPSNYYRIAPGQRPLDADSLFYLGMSSTPSQTKRVKRVEPLIKRWPAALQEPLAHRSETSPLRTFKKE